MIRREAVDIAAYGKIEVAGGDLVDLGKVGIEHDLSAAHDVDAPVNDLVGTGSLSAGDEGRFCFLVAIRC